MISFPLATDAALMILLNFSSTIDDYRYYHQLLSLSSINTPPKNHNTIFHQTKLTNPLHPARGSARTLQSRPKLYEEPQSPESAKQVLLG
jgi:hypothetical protein